MDRQARLEAIHQLKATREYRRNNNLLDPICDALEHLLEAPATPAPPPPSAEVTGGWSVEAVPPAVPPLDLGARIADTEKRARKRLSKRDAGAEINQRVKAIVPDPPKPQPGRISNTSPGTVAALKDAAAKGESPTFEINLYV
jgi:hypothetical protein